jgi:hypothetical protein
MSGLAALLAEHNPPSVYQWHSAAPVADVQHAVEHAGWSFRYLDGWTLEDRATFLKAAASALELPDDGAESVGALSTSLTQVEVAGRGLVVLWDGWSPLARSDGPTFDETLGAFRRRAHTSEVGKLAVILRGEGPDLDVPELPIKH